MTTAKRVVLYVRVSTSDQTCENQKRELRAWARARPATRSYACSRTLGSREPTAATSVQASTPCSRLRSGTRVRYPRRVVV